MTRDRLGNATDFDWQAQWIWPRGRAWTGRAASLRLSAYTDYTVWVNGAPSQTA